MLPLIRRIHVYDGVLEAEDQYALIGRFNGGAEILQAIFHRVESRDVEQCGHIAEDTACSVTDRCNGRLLVQNRAIAAAAAEPAAPFPTSIQRLPQLDIQLRAVDASVRQSADEFAAVKAELPLILRVDVADQLVGTQDHHAGRRVFQGECQFPRLLLCHLPADGHVPEAARQFPDLVLAIDRQAAERAGCPRFANCGRDCAQRLDERPRRQHIGYQCDHQKEKQEPQVIDV